AEIDRRSAELKERQAALRRSVSDLLFEAKLAGLPEPIRSDTKAALKTTMNKRNEIQKYLATKLEAQLKIRPEEVQAALSAKQKQTLAELDQQVADLQRRRRGWDVIQAVYDVAPSAPTHVLRRGNYETPGPAVEPGFPGVLGSGASSFAASAVPQGRS